MHKHAFSQTRRNELRVQIRERCAHRRRGGSHSQKAITSGHPCPPVSPPSPPWPAMARHGPPWPAIPARPAANTHTPISNTLHPPLRHRSSEGAHALCPARHSHTASARRLFRLGRLRPHAHAQKLRHATPAHTPPPCRHRSIPPMSRTPKSAALHKSRPHTAQARRIHRRL